MENEKLLDFRFYMVHPAVTAVYYIGFLMLAFLFSNPVFILTVMAFSVITAVYYNGYSPSAGTFKASLIIGAFMVIINPLTSHRGAHILFYLFNNPITLEAVAGGVYNAVLFATVFIVFLCFNRFIDSERFLYVFSRLSPKVAFIANMTLRYIWLYKDRARELTQVQSIGMNNDKESRTTKIKRYGKLLSALVSWSLEEGMKTSIVLKAKDYGNRNRSNYILYKFTLSDGLLLFILLLVLALLMCAEIFGIGKYNIYPNLSPVNMNLYDRLAYALLLFYLGIPLLMECFTALRRKIINGDSITA